VGRHPDHHALPMGPMGLPVSLALLACLRFLLPFDFSST
jgi:hypothetical protein